MKKAIKKEGKIVKAYRLGTDSPKIMELLMQGKIKNCGGGNYEVFSQEAVNGIGEVAQDGDYIKLDSNGFPYPNDRKFFEENHRKAGRDAYEQIPKAVEVWTAQEPYCEEIEYLLREKGLVINENDADKYFNAPLWGSMLSARKDAALVFYRIDRDQKGKIVDADFNFVEQGEFQLIYKYI